MTLASIIVSAQEKENRFSFLLFFTNIKHTLCSVNTGYYGIFFSTYFLYIYNPEVQKHKSFFHSLLKYVVVVSNHVLLNPLICLL